MLPYPLHQLVIPKEWKIIKNEFYAIDPQDDISDDDKFNHIYCLQDMLLLEKTDYFLDLGWYGGDGKDGRYTLHLFKDGDWMEGKLIKKYSSRKSNEIAAKINKILSTY